MATNPEAEEIGPEELRAASEVLDALEGGTHYERQHKAHREMMIEWFKAAGHSDAALERALARLDESYAKLMADNEPWYED